MGCQTSRPVESAVAVSEVNVFNKMDVLGRRALMDSEIQKRVAFQRKCEASEIGWVKFSYLRHLGGSPLPRRQDIPEHALHVGAPLSESTPFVISHPWLGQQHADVTGEQVAEAVSELLRLGARDNDLVFYDYSCMYQRSLSGEDDRTPAQLKSFTKQLGAINTLYASDLCTCVVLSSIPTSVASAPSLEATVPYHPGQFTIVTNPVPYEKRGWCFFELLVMLLFKTCKNLGRQHDGALDDLLMTQFSEAIFTNGADRKLVVRKAKEVLTMSAEDRLEEDEDLEEVLAAGHVRLVRFGFLRNLVREGKIVPRRQDCPEEAFGDHRRRCKRVALSYPWNSRDHPDPFGEIAKRVVERALRLGLCDDDLVFWDWMSLHQLPRTEAETESFKRALRSINTLYTGTLQRTLVITYVQEEGLPYRKRGWTLFELVLSAFAGNLIYDSSDVMDIIVEHFFLPNLVKKTFTNGKEDLPLVAGLFKSLLYERAGMTLLDDDKDRKIEALKAEFKKMQEGGHPEP